MPAGLRPRAITRAALACALLTIAAGVVATALPLATDFEYLWGLIPLFDPGREANVPTWFSSALLLGSAAALAAAGLHLRHARAPGARWWLVLAAVFCLASLDETANLHELLSRQARREFQPGFGQLWVLVLGPVAVIFVAVYAVFLSREGREVRRAFALGAALFVGGALGVEVVEIAAELTEAGAVATAAVTLGQEALELLGAVVLLHASLLQLRAATTLPDR